MNLFNICVKIHVKASKCVTYGGRLSPWTWILGSEYGYVMSWSIEVQKLKLEWMWLEEVYWRQASENKWQQTTHSNVERRHRTGLSSMIPYFFNFYPYIYDFLLLLSCFSCVRLCATPQTAAHQAPPSLGFRQECWSGISMT